VGAAVVEEICRAVALMRRLVQKPPDPFERFRKDFSDRYGDGREVPLIEVLDEEIGIGFERSGGAGAEASPLLRGLALPSPAADPTTPWTQKQAFLLSRLSRALAAGEEEIALTDDEVAKIAPAPAAGTAENAIADAFQVMATIASPSREAIARGEFQVLVSNASGPSGARLLGRFCHADPALTREVEAHLRAEEALRPDALFLEIVHLPQGRIGNILSRPVLRDYELAYLGRSGAAVANQLPITDLLVSIVGSRVVLRSARLGREVIPRLTSAHNYSTRSLGVYRFLCTLQSQGVLGGVAWNWGALDGAPFLPRLTYGRIVLHRAAWWMTGDEIKALKPLTGTARFAAVRQWRKRRRLPRLVLLADGDNELLVDLENALSVDTFLDVVEDRDRARLHELFPGPDELPATGPEGRFVHEILIPFVRRPQETLERRPAAPRPTAAAATHPSVRRSFPPGSEWLYAKLYTGTSTADGVLNEVIAPVVAATVGSAADSWFFIRYGDPEWHLRVRFHGDPTALQTTVLPALAAAAAPLLDDGRLWKVQLDTYEREIERYGGPRGIELSERLFMADSEAVVTVLSMLDGDEGADARWRLALYGADQLLGDLGLDAAAKLAVMGELRTSFAQEFAGGSDLKGIRVQLDQRLRGERKSLDTLLYASDAEHPLAPGLEVFTHRSQRQAPIIAELAAREKAGELTLPILQIAPSYVHMFVNRIIRSAGRAHEMVIYDFLYQLYQSRLAREKKRPREEAAQSA
ncbi:MAG TPA: lantibiotic dehydratase, partial [Thermoanaerobaculia bacterium]